MNLAGPPAKPKYSLVTDSEQVEEDKQKPLPDDQLAEILKERGYPIARRTIAKYRELLDIPVARMRKKNVIYL